MVLSDRDIKSLIEEDLIKIDPLEMERIQGVSVDLELGEEINYIKRVSPVKPFEDLSRHYQTHSLKQERYILTSGAFVLGYTKEYIVVPGNLIGFIDTRNSLARKGLSVTLSSVIKPGFEGHIPLAIKNFSNVPIELVDGMRICQLMFQRISSSVEWDAAKADASQKAGISMAEIKSLLEEHGVTGLSEADLLKLRSSLSEFINNSSESIIKQVKEKIY